MVISANEPSQPAGVPVIALLLGWAGVIPFAALAAVVVPGAHPYAGAALSALVAYGSVILSFMGGVLWGLEMSQGRWQPAYAVSVAPALVAAASMVLHPTHGILLLLCGFSGLLSYDMKQSRSRDVPSWYPLLRWQLTAAVTSLLSVALLFTWLA